MATELKKLTVDASNGSFTFEVVDAEARSKAAEAKSAADGISIPSALPNPKKLTFTGGASGTYDGSKDVTINIPTGGSGEGGEDGGYYTPAVTQPTDTTMEVAFTPSKTGMPSVAPVTVNLPVGSGSGSSPNVDKLVLKSPDGTEWNITVSNEGVVTATKQGADGEPTVVLSWDFGELSEVPSVFTVRGDAEQVTIEDGMLAIRNKGLNTNLIDIEGFESDYCRLDYWATYPTNKDAWNSFVAWGYSSKWLADGENIGIWSAITSEIDIFEQGMPAGATYETSANNVFVGSDIHVYEVWDASGGHDVGAGAEHKFSFVKNKNLFTWLFDDVEVRTVDVTSYEAMPLTSEYTVDRNTLLLPHWFNIYCQTSGASDGTNVLKLRKIQFSTVEGEEVLPTAIHLSNDYVSGVAPVGAKLLLVKEFTPDTTFNKFTTWESTNEAVATVNVGVVKCLSEGNCTIRAIAPNGVVGEYALTVDNSVTIPCIKVKVDKETLSMAIGTPETITATLFPSYTSDDVSWESDNEEIATVDGGVVTPVAAGNCNITFTCGSHSVVIPVTVAAAKSLIYENNEISGALENMFNADFTKDFTIIWDLNVTSSNNYWNASFRNPGSTSKGKPRIEGGTAPTVSFLLANDSYVISESWAKTSHKVAFVCDVANLNSKIFIDGVLASEAAIADYVLNGYVSGSVGIDFSSVTGGIKVYNYAMGDDEAVTATTLSSSGGDDSGDNGETEKTLTNISATYSGGDVAVGTAVTDLTGIVVTATYSDGSTATVTGYTLSGEIAEGSNTITVSYEGMTTTFAVTGVAESGGDDEFVENAPAIAQTNAKMNQKGEVAIDNARAVCVTDFIPFDTTTEQELFTLYLSDPDGILNGTSDYYAVYKDGVFVDYWSPKTINAEVTDKKINADANQVRFTLAANGVDDSYAYFNDTGKVIFAGKNTKYYGHGYVHEVE